MTGETLFRTADRVRRGTGRWARALAFLSVGALALPAAAASAKTIHVPRDNADLTQALLEASPGDTVQVAPGEYRTRLVLPAGVVFLSEAGPDSTILRGAVTYLIEIRGSDDGTVVKGFTMNCRPAAEIGILVQAGSPLIEGNVIRDGFDGVNVNGDGKPIVRGNRIEGCRRGVAASGCDLIIEKNVFTRNTVAVDLVSASPVIQSNRFEHNRTGIQMELYSYPVIGGGLNRANDFVENRTHLVNGSLATVGSTRTQDRAVITAKYNYWGTLCPTDEEVRFQGICRLKPWTDDVHQGRYVSCPGQEGGEADSGD